MAGAAMGLMVLVAGAFSWPGAAAVDAGDLESLDRGERLRAVERVGGRAAELGGDEVRRLLAPLLDDADAGVRAGAARVLLRERAPEAAETALRWLTSRSPADRPLGLQVFRDAAELPPAARAGVEHCLRDTDLALRLLALEVLARHGPAPSFAALAAALDDEQREVRVRAVRLLEDTRDRRAVTLLLGRLGDSDRQVSLEAVAALGTLGDPGAAPALVRAVESGAEDTRLAAIDALGQLGWAGAVPVLAPIARHRPSDEAGRRALLALGQVGSPAAVAVLIDRLRAPPVPDEVREGLRRAGGRAVASLCAVLEGAGRDAPAGAVAAAAAIVGALGDRRATAPLATIVDRGLPGTVEALRALAALKDPAAIVALVRAAGDRDADVRRLAFEAMLAVGAPGSAAALPAGLTDADRDVRRAALRLAARLDARAVEPATGSGGAGVLAAVLTGVLDNLGREETELRRGALVALAAWPAAPPAALAAILGAAQRLDRAAGTAETDPEALALGDALEAVVAGADVGDRNDGASLEADRRALSQAFVAARGAARLPILRGLCAALARGRAPKLGAVPRGSLMAAVAAGGALGEAAADALVAGGVGSSDEAELIAAFDQAEAAVRARLAVGLARAATAATLARLRAAIDDESEAEAVRAAAAWAATGVRDGGVRAALARGAAEGPRALRANARAALASPNDGERWSRWTAVRVTMPGGFGPLPGRWIILRGDGREPVWAMTGLGGDVRAFGVGGGAVAVSAAEGGLAIGR